VTRFADYEQEIYLRGSRGEVPGLPMTATEMEAKAREVMLPRVFGYVAGSAGLEHTAEANLEAFRRWSLLPRQLQGVAERDLSVELLGRRLPTPLLLAPIGALGSVAEMAEVKVARAATGIEVPLILSTVSSTRMERVASELQAAGGGVGWFQLYWPDDRELALSLVGRAEAAGYSALVVTVDTWTLAWRPRDLAHGYLPFLTGEGLANYLSDPVFRSRLDADPEADPAAAIALWSRVFSHPGLRWEDLSWLRGQTHLPLVVKGICHPEDARLAAEAGASAVVVSNHGGRQVDGAAAALDCLVDIAGSAPPIPLLFDSGIRSGADCAKALALGARAVLIGRPYVYGLAVGGEEGVRHVLRCLLAELDLTLGLCGYAGVSDLSSASLRRAG
jgi:lactate 2-monooxygenase